MFGLAKVFECVYMKGNRKILDKRPNSFGHVLLSCMQKEDVSLYFPTVFCITIHIGLNHILNRELHEYDCLPVLVGFAFPA